MIFVSVFFFLSCRPGVWVTDNVRATGACGVIGTSGGRGGCMVLVLKRKLLLSSAGEGVVAPAGSRAICLPVADA